MASREVTTSVTIATDDVGFIIEANNSTTDTLFIYVPNNATVPINDRDEIKILRSGTGPVVVIATGSSVFINGVETGSASIIKQYGLANLIKVDTDSWAVAGDIVLETDTSFELVTPNIPDLTQPANIQEAFLQYHYGTTATVSNINDAGEGSIAKYIYLLDQKVQAAVSGSVVVDELDVSTDLNTKTQTGYFYSPETPGTGLNYPEIKSGILGVYKNPEVTNGAVTQLYQTFTTSTTPSTDKVWIRSQIYNSTLWGAWTSLANNYDIATLSTTVSTLTINSLANVNVVTPLNNQVLTYNSTQGKWINASPATLNGYQFYRRLVYSVAGSNTWRTSDYPTVTIKGLVVTAVGGGGGGGGTNSGGTNSPNFGGGGGGGAYTQGFIEVPAGSQTVNFTVGAGGNGGSGGSSGSNGTASSFILNGVTISANGGGGGIGTTANLNSGSSTADGGTGGAASTGTNILSVPGSNGSTGHVNHYFTGTTHSNTRSVITANGGDSVLGFGARGIHAGNTRAGSRFGGGGAGSFSTGSSGTGGAGAAGVVIIDMYI